MAPLGGFEEAEETVRRADAAVAGHRRRRVLIGSLLHAESLPSALVNRMATGQAVSLRGEPYDAMAAFQRAVATGVAAPAIGAGQLIAAHRAIVPRGGALRRKLVWLAGDSPADAIFVPPPAELVPGLLDDLVAYLDRRDVCPLEQAAVAYGQLEFIHPFLDGNGRVGRYLMQVITRRRGLVAAVAPPLGLLFAAHLPNFIDAHRRFRDGDHEAWCRYVATLATVSARNTIALAASPTR